jgi:glycosyltransferase involved in cell wall biosynthesis
LSSRLWSWLSDFGPDVVFSNLGSIRQIRLVSQICGRASVPLVPYFNDDWPTTHYREDIFKRLPRLVLVRELDRLIDKMPTGVTASTVMAHEYTERFAKKFEPIMQSVRVPQEWRPPVHRPEQDIRFVYVGGLHLGRWQGIRDVARALSLLRDRGHGCTLDIYAPDNDLERSASVFRGFSCVRKLASVPPESAPSVLSDADVVVFVESFDRILRQYTKLSLSTKIPSYMAAGRPILAFAPPEIASVRHIQDCGAGLCVSDQSAAALLGASEALVGNVDLRLQLGRNGWDSSRRFHEQLVVQGQFRRILADAAAGLPAVADRRIAASRMR